MKSRHYQLKEAWNKVLLYEMLDLGSFVPAPLRFEGNTEYRTTYSAMIDGDRYKFYLTKNKPRHWELEFDRTHEGDKKTPSFEMTGKYIILPIMATLNEVLKKFITQEFSYSQQPLVISYSGAWETGEDFITEPGKSSKRHNFFDRYFPRMFQNDSFYKNYRYKFETTGWEDIYTEMTFTQRPK
jgi:hypothetical protein